MPFKLPNTCRLRIGIPLAQSEFENEFLKGETMKKQFVLSLVLFIGVLGCGVQRKLTPEDQKKTENRYPESTLQVIKTVDPKSVMEFAGEGFDQNYRVFGAVDLKDLPPDFLRIPSESAIGKVTIVKKRSVYAVEYEDEVATPVHSLERKVLNEPAYLFRFPKSEQVFFAVKSTLKTEFEDVINAVTVQSGRIMSYCKTVHVPHWKEGSLYMKEQNASCDESGYCQYRLHWEPASYSDRGGPIAFLKEHRGQCTEIAGVFKKTESRYNRTSVESVQVDLDAGTVSQLERIIFKI